jgi:hypothetical protein
MHTAGKKAGIVMLSYRKVQEEHPHLLEHLEVYSQPAAASWRSPVGYMPIFGGRIPPAVEREPEPQPRQMKLMRVDFEDNVYTKGCKGCGALWRKGHPHQHTAACRTLMEIVLGPIRPIDWRSDERRSESIVLLKAAFAKPWWPPATLRSRHSTAQPATHIFIFYGPAAGHA